MPQLTKIVIQDFRNIGLQELYFSRKINCISGGNGEGKTNLLDAIWYLSMTKGNITAPESYNFKFGTNSFGLSGLYLMENGRETHIGIHVSKNADSSVEKKISRDDKIYKRNSEHIGLLPVVMVSPSDSAMISESGDGRRKFSNSVLSQMDVNFLSDIQQYNRYLLQRNKLLKDGVRDSYLLDTLDEGLDRYGSRIFESRLSFSEKIAPSVSEYYKAVSGGKESIGIEYKSCCQKGKLSDILLQSRNQDMALKFTSSGIQRDDFIFTMNGHAIRHCGSQGQQKSFLVALKFAQYDLMSKSYGFPPILLLDDLFDKLDVTRVSNLLSMVASSEFGQIFLTDSNKTRIRGVVNGVTEDSAFYIAGGGAFNKENE